MANSEFILWLLLLFSCLSWCFGSDLDVQCLKTLQQSVVDPNGILKSTWIFENGSNGFICQFTGVECWQPGVNRVLSLGLSNLGLQGQFPQGLENCTSMVSLDLSGNNFSGPIPSDIARQIQFVTTLDLSYNSFSGEIPMGIWNSQYLNAINLQHNKFSGQIPDPVSLPHRLALFSVADNQLSGPIPWALQNFSVSSFAANQKLCGAPLGDCPSNRKWWLKVRLPRINDESSIGVAVGFVVGFVVAFYFPRIFVCSRRLRVYFQL